MPDGRMAIDELADERLVTRKIVVVSEPGRNGAAALAQAAELAAISSAQLTVVAAAPHSSTSCRSCGGVSPVVYNRAVRDDIAQGLRDAISRLDLDPADINVTLLIEGTDPPLANWVAQGGFDVVLLPARRSGLRLRDHPAASLLSGLTGADVRVITA